MRVIKVKKKLLFLAVALVLLVVCSSVAFAAEGGGIFSGLASAANFIKRLFVPAPNYFYNKLGELSAHVNDRLGGLGQLYQMLHGFFSELSHPLTNGLTFRLPNNYFFAGFRGFSVDVLQSARPYIQLLRDVLTAAYCLLIAIICFHKLRTFFSE